MRLTFADNCRRLLSLYCVEIISDDFRYEIKYVAI